MLNNNKKRSKKFIKVFLFIFLFICFIDEVKAASWNWESEDPITNTTVIHNNPITCSMDWQNGGSSIFSTGHNLSFTMKLYRYESEDADNDDYLSVSSVTHEFSSYLSYYDEYPILFEFNAPIAWLGDYYYLCQLEWTGYLNPDAVKAKEVI